MKAICNRAALFEAVQLASSIVPTRTPKPILQCARIEAHKDNRLITVVATDGEIIICSTIPQVDVETAGYMVVPADRLAAILHESSEPVITLELIDGTCHITGQDSHFLIYGHDPDDYPVLELSKPQYMLEMEEEVLRRMIHKSLFAAARESTRFAINGVLWEFKGKKLRMVATDGRRMARVDGVGVSAEAEVEGEAIVPGKTMAVIERSLNTPDEKVGIALEDTQINVRTAMVQISSNLVQGRFPQYNDVIPAPGDKKVRVEREVLLSAVRRVSLLTNEQSKGIQLNFSQNKLCLTSSTPEAGEAEVNLPVQYEGEPFKIGFNPQYLLEMLRVVDNPEVSLEMVDASKPGVIKAGKDFLYVLMPVAV